jgi:hypothetical protein
MPNPKFDALHRQRQQSHAERLFSKEPLPPAPQQVAEVAETRAGAEESFVHTSTDDTLKRRSYIILRGRIEPLPSLELKNRRGQTRLLPWNYFGGANLDHPGELVLFFDGPEGSCQVTVNGRGLDVELLDGIKAQKVSLIQELDDLAVAAVAREDPDEPVVTGVWIKGGGREWSRPAGHGR